MGQGGTIYGSELEKNNKSAQKRTATYDLCAGVAMNNVSFFRVLANFQRL